VHRCQAAFKLRAVNVRYPPQAGDHQATPKRPFTPMSMLANDGEFVTMSIDTDKANE
jgi:hypothetical protein